MTVRTSNCAAVAIGANLNYVLFFSLNFQRSYAFLHGILESSGQAEPFAPPRESNIDSDDIERTAQLGNVRRH